MTTTADPGPTEHPIDHGYFGPDSLAWRIFLHPATQVMIAQVTNLLELPHVVFQHVLAEHDPMFGAPPRSRNIATGPKVNGFDRVVRTVSIPAPILFGSTEEADRASRKLFNYHRPMHGTLADSGEKYSATDPDSMLFAAVTIAHAAWLAYENYAYVDGRRVDPFTDDEVTRYLSETVHLGTLMGAPAEKFPRSRAELEDYYDSLAPMYRTKPGWTWDQLNALVRLVKPGDGRRPRHVARDVMVLISEIAALAVLPDRFRRLNGVPTAADPALRVMYRSLLPLYRRLASDPRWTEWVYDVYRGGDPEKTRLLNAALATRRT